MLCMTIIDLQKKHPALTSFDLDLLLTAAIKKPKEFLYSHPEYRLSPWQRLRLKYFLFLQKKGYSVAAIAKHKEFYGLPAGQAGLDFFVNRHVLIPRPETELMVEEAAREITNVKLQMSNQIQNPNAKLILIDVGTGSGCVPISIFKTLQPTPTPPKRGITLFATDISRSALRVAKKNAKNHRVNIKFLRGNLLQPILKKYSLLPTPYSLIITANLPYLTEQQFQSEPSIQREPKIALVAEKNGLALYEELFKQIPLLPTPHSLLLLLEIDPSQTEKISKLIKQYFPSANLAIKKDLAGRDRLVIIKI